MTTLSDAIRAVVGGTSINDGLMSYFAANGGVGTTLPDLERSFLLSQLGLASSAATTNDLWKQFLVAFTGSLPDQLLQFWLAGGAGAGWTPAEWFQSGEQGAAYWITPDFVGLYQDSAGATPVTAVEQSVGRVEDRSGNGNHLIQATTASKPKLTARKNLLTYTEDFSNAAWGGSSVNVSANAHTDPNGTLTADKLIATASFGFHVKQQSATVASGATITQSVSLKQAGMRYAFVYNDSAAKGAIFDLQGGVVSGTVLGAPISSSMEDQGDGWWRCSITVTVPSTASVAWVGPTNSSSSASITGDDVNGVYAWGAQLEYGTTATRYQRVTTATDYDTVGFPHRLKFDGVDDFLSTPGNVDFSSTDKMTVVAGVTKLSDSGGIIAELSASIDANAGTFVHAAGNVVGGYYGALARGSAATSGAQGANTAAFIAPDKCVLTAAHNISGDSSVGRRNGVQFGNGTADKGTGNFGSYPLYVGRRGGTLFPFNGEWSSLVIRGAQTADVTPGEEFAADLHGVTL